MVGGRDAEFALMLMDDLREALARGIVKELRAAGLEIRSVGAISIRNPRR
jgi:hypothetical protein